MTDFLPKNYTVPTSAGKYMKFQQGANRFRFLDKPIMGTEYWNTEGKPVRLKPGISINMEDIGDGKYGKQDPKYFWAMPVWSYRDNQVQVLEITQKTILKPIVELSRSEDWGSPLEYDLIVTKEGEEKETEYMLSPTPHKPLSEEAKQAWEKVKREGFDCSRLYDGSDPFDGKSVSTKEINIDDIPF